MATLFRGDCDAQRNVRMMCAEWQSPSSNIGLKDIQDSNLLREGLIRRPDQSAEHIIPAPAPTTDGAPACA